MSFVTVINKSDASKSVAASLGLNENPSQRTIIAQSIRREVYISAPCKRRTLCELVVSALSFLSENEDQLSDVVDDVIEDLVGMGDVLEMWTETDVSRNYVLRPAPPAFILRKDGTFLILGVAGDEITPVRNLPIQYLPSGLRTLTTNDSYETRDALISFGLIELPETAWMRSPKPETATDFRQKWITRLPTIFKPEAITGLDVLDPTRPDHFYKGRWREVQKSHNGLFIARRPQLYGAKLWSLAEIRNGVVQRFVDIHSSDARFRDCDEAWRLQAAIDAFNGKSQKVKVSNGGGKVCLSFLSPLPTWAVRRLAFMGDRVESRNALLAFELPTENLQEELDWLHAKLWLSRDQGG